MKVNKIKKILLSLFISSLVALLLYPFAVYFAFNVDELKTHYPQFKLLKGEVDHYSITKKKPAYWVHLPQISTYGKWAIILSEDWAFYQHQGVDLEQLKIAVGDVFTSGKVRGASTISQQMVKNIYLDPSRSVFRKIKELIITYKVEKFLNKQRILEIYLNSIEFGPGIWGIRNASYHYFGKHPSQINPREASFLAMMLPSPKRYYESFRKKKLTRFAKVRVHAILAKLKMGKIISDEEFYLNRVMPMSWEH